MKETSKKVELKLKLDKEDHQKLVKLAEYRKMSVEEVIIRFIRTASPGGTGWVPPGGPIPK